MGHQDRIIVGAPTNGTEIFYARKGKCAKPRGSSKAKQLSQPATPQRTIPLAPSTQQRPSIPSSNKPSPILLSPDSGTLANELYNNESIGTSVSSLPVKGDLNGNPGATISALRNNAATITALIKTTAGVFQNAPYIEVIAGVVQKIIQIADDVQTNKDRSLELIDKVTNYARVVFEALRSPQINSGNGLEELKEDLLHITSIFENIYQILQSSTDDTFTARFSRIVHREEILARIEEQDRRLDSSIASFQLKSSIVLRTTNVRPVNQKVELISQPMRAFHSNKLRTRPQIMFGRDREIENLVTMISEAKRSRLAILGSGGIGKTSLALSVLHDSRTHSRFGDNRLFVSCEAATCADHVILDIARALQIPSDSVNGQLLNTVLDRLQQSPFLVVLDNFETPWEIPGARPAVEALLQDLADTKTVTILITMRGSQHPSGIEWSHLFPPLQPIDLESATAIFQAISKKADEHAISLIQAVDRVPLAVTLLANLAAVDGETTEALLQRWHQENTAMVENGNGRLTSLDCSVQLSLSSSRMRRDPDALSFLSLLALLPDGMSNETYISFSDGLPGIPNVRKAVSTLRQNALISMDSNGSIKVLSPIRLYMRAHHPPPPEPRYSLQDYFLDLAYKGTSHSDLEVKQRLFTEAENIEAMLVDSLEFGWPLDDVVEAILTFCNHTYVNGVSSTGALCLAIMMFQKLPASTIQSRDSRIRTPKQRTPRFLRFGDLHFWKDNTQRQMQDVKACEANPTLKLHGDCLGCWGQILMRQLRFEEAKEKFLLAIELHVQAGDTAGQAYDLHNFGKLLLRKSATFAEAQKRFLEATKLHEQINDRIGSAYDLMGLGQVFLRQSQLQKAVTTFSNALNLFIECDDELGAASALNSLGQAMSDGSKFLESEGHFSRALHLNVKMGNVVGEAESLAGLAYTLLLRSRFEEAKLRIEEAIAVRAPIEDPDHLQLLGRVLISQYKFDQAKQVTLKAQVLHQKIDDELGGIGDKQSLFYIFYYNGNFTEMAEEFRSLHDLCLSRNDLLGRANALAAYGMVRIQRSELDAAAADLDVALKLHIQVGSLLGQAFDLNHIGCLHLQRGEIDDAVGSLQQALALHTEIENVQGQADALIRLAVASLRRQRHDDALTEVCRALALHTQIGDYAGQGDDLYVQACVFLEQSRLLEAEKTIIKALELHIRSSIFYSQVRDLTTLSSVLWKRFRCDGGAECRAETIDALEKAIDMFNKAGTSREGDDHRCKLREIAKDAPHMFAHHAAPDA